MRAHTLARSGLLIPRADRPGLDLNKRSFRQSDIPEIPDSPDSGLFHLQRLLNPAHAYKDAVDTTWSSA